MILMVPHTRYITDHNMQWPQEGVMFRSGLPEVTRYWNQRYIFRAAPSTSWVHSWTCHFTKICNNKTWFLLYVKDVFSLLILLSLTNTADILFADITSAVVVFPKLDIFENSKVILLFVWYFLQQLTSSHQVKISRNLDFHLHIYGNCVGCRQVIIRHNLVNWVTFVFSLNIEHGQVK